MANLIIHKDVYNTTLLLQEGKSVSPRKAQVTITTLLGIVIIFVVTSLSFLYQYQLQAKQQLEPTVMLPLYVQEVYSYVLSCVRNIAPVGIAMLGTQSGYYEKPPFPLNTQETTLAYYIIKNESHVPSSEEIGYQLALMIEDTLPVCTDFSRFPSLLIKPADQDVNVLVRENDVLVKVNYPLAIVKGAQTVNLNEPYTVTLPVRLKKIHQEVSAIVRKDLLQQGAYDLVFLLNTGLDVALIPYNEHTVIYAVTDASSQINGIPYTFIFANEK